jgi:hypothetical protein
MFYSKQYTNQFHLNASGQEPRTRGLHAETMLRRRYVCCLVLFGTWAKGWVSTGLKLRDSQMVACKAEMRAEGANGQSCWRLGQKNSVVTRQE